MEAQAIAHLWLALALPVTVEMSLCVVCVHTQEATKG